MQSKAVKDRRRRNRWKQIEFLNSRVYVRNGYRFKIQRQFPQDPKETRKMRRRIASYTFQPVECEYVYSPEVLDFVEKFLAEPKNQSTDQAQ